MVKENLALVIVEEGVDADVSTEGLGCCFTMFAFFGNY